MDEIGRLASTFNLMVERLESAIDVQRRFVADTAHELRTPLSTILGNVDLLVRYGDNPRRRRSSLTSIKREGERTSRLAADLLLLAQADAGQNLELRPLELDEILVEVYEQVQGLTDGVFVLMGQCDPTFVMGDRDRLKQMLLNLVDNALKHTDHGGRVTLSLRTGGGMADLAVTDTGSGIPKKDLPHIFERFYRVQDRTHRGKRSTGLGLAIVKWIAEEHGGNVTVESRVGEGSTFVVSIPTQDV
jgi:signal transduction histidine kinase